MDKEINLNTHTKLPKKYGYVVDINEEEGSAKVVLETIQEMAVDEEGLIHGAFTFGAADLCAMATVNEPYVVLVKSSCEFLAPVKVGDRVEFVSETLMKEKRKHEIKVRGFLKDIKVFEGLFSCVVLENHVLKK